MMLTPTFYDELLSILAPLGRGGLDLDCLRLHGESVRYWAVGQARRLAKGPRPTPLAPTPPGARNAAMGPWGPMVHRWRCPARRPTMTLLRRVQQYT
jgi:hypothetical protein